MATSFRRTLSRKFALFSPHPFSGSRAIPLYSSANNHLVAEAAGEYLISLAMPEISRARSTKKRAAFSSKKRENNSMKTAFLPNNLRAMARSARNCCFYAMRTHL